ncbi:MAG: ATP-dependent nuclease subunit B-like protein [Verrucomicrobiaceae bacterium]|nr:ATP-dependent nuclease subunit B-like protein [Verrucomicrobiaceae bacterium]
MIRRVFWGWDQPVLDRAIALLTEKWQGGELDLGDALIIVPTAESGRRLKEALARATALRGGAVSAPHVWAPERALLTQADRQMAASEPQSRLAWTKLMQEVPPESLPHLFPVPPADRGWTWAAEMGRALLDMTTALGAGGKSFADVAAMEDLPMERERWQELALLESHYRAILHALGTEDLQALKLKRASQPELPEGVRRILVLPSPDLPVLFRHWLEAASGLVPVMIYVQAPALREDDFDAYGAPFPACWGEKADLVVPLADEQIHLEHDPAGQARRVLELAREWIPRQTVALAVCDPEVTAHLDDRLQQEGVKTYEPGGVPASRHGTVQMLGLWATLIDTDGWQPFAALLRMPEVRDALSGSRGADGMRLIAEADAFAGERLPVTLGHALEVMPAWLAVKIEAGRDTLWAESLHKAMLAAQSLAAGFNGGQPLHEAARTLLIKIFGERFYRTESPQHRDHVKICTDWLRVCEDLHREALALNLGTSHLLGLSIEWLNSQRLTDPRGDIDLVLIGWLELLWETAPALVISGFNEEHVPGIQISHLFLPDHLRQALGIASQASRFARDAYLLTALAGQRAGKGRLRLTCGLWSEGKDTLRPSRLLFLCPDKDLPRRVRHLFPQDLESALPKELPRQRAWKLQPPVKIREPLKEVSASRLSAYLRCPFTYYLDYVLRMGGVDAAKRELDAMEYGNLVHAALTVLQAEAGKTAGSEAAAISALLVDAVEKRAAQLYGRRLPVPVELQLDAARQRLSAAAGIEADLREGGWQTRHAEVVLGDASDKTPLLIEGARFIGRIDRVDRHPNGITRIIDYKTSDKSQPPADAHFKKLGKRTRVAPEDEWKVFINSQSQACLWQDLQLPLYAKAWGLREPGPVTTAYWNLPKAMDDAALIDFTDLDATMIEAAMACASEAVRRINAGIFWPPAKGSRFDKYEGLIHGDVHEAVEWQGLVGTTTVPAPVGI